MRELATVIADAEGLTVQSKPRTPKRVRWEDVLAVTAFKVDLFTFDQVVVRFETADDHLEINEDMHGFHESMTEVCEYLPGFPSMDDWKPKVVIPPFAPSSTDLWHKERH